MFMTGWWQQISGTVAQGLQITIVGMSLVFFTLGLIILALVLLTRLPWLQAKTEKQEQETGQAQQQLVSQPRVEHKETLSPVSNDAELAQVAAIAVALLRNQRSITRRPKMRAATSKWKQYGRAHQLGL